MGSFWHPHNLALWAVFHASLSPHNPPPKTDLYLMVVGGEQPSRECVVRLCQQEWMPFAKYPPRALSEVERLTMNPKKLANIGARCWKDSLGQNKWTHQPPYSTRRRLVTDWQETKKLLQEEIRMDNVWKDLKENTIGNYQDWWSDKKQKRSLEESYESLIIGIADGGEKRREEPHNLLQSWEFRGQQLSASSK